jgi:hypothetical protein
MATSSFKAKQKSNKYLARNVANPELYNQKPIAAAIKDEFLSTAIDSKEENKSVLYTSNSEMGE